jgi:hypothetical protein
MVEAGDCGLHCELCGAYAKVNGGGGLLKVFEKRFVQGYVFDGGKSVYFHLTKEV